MERQTIKIKYNINKWNGKPYNTDDLHPQGVMQLNLHMIFQTYKQQSGKNKGKEKCLNVMHNRKILKFILQAGSQENIEQLEKWLKNNSKLWLKEYEKLRDRG